MKQFFEEYRFSEILQLLVGEISWSKHFVIMGKCKNEQERQFYTLATTLPEAYKKKLPSAEELASKLDAFIELSKEQKP